MAIEVRPIRSAADHRAAMAMVKRLWGSKIGTPDGDRLDVLATLIDAYEAQHEPIDRPDPIEAIRFRMEQQGLTRKDLEPLIGTRTRNLGSPQRCLLEPRALRPAAEPNVSAATAKPVSITWALSHFTCRMTWIGH